MRDINPFEEALVSYNGTIYCSYCWEKGHNRLYCEKRKNDVEKTRKDQPDHYLVREYDEAHKSKSVRSCKYCKEEGHNRRSCKILKKDKARAFSECSEWRTQALKAMDELGLGVGALVRVADRIGLVMSLNWNIGSQLATKDRYGRTDSRDDSRGYQWLSFGYAPRMLEVKFAQTSWMVGVTFPIHPLVSPHSDVEVLSPAPESFSKEAPKGWVKEEPPYDVTKHFIPENW